MYHLYAHKYVMHVEYLTYIYIINIFINFISFIKFHRWAYIIYESILHLPVYIHIKYIYLKDAAKPLMSARKKAG